MATLFVDLENGNNANNGQSFANRKKTVKSAADVASAGDTIRVMGHPAVSLGDGTWTDKSKVLTLATPRTKNIALCNLNSFVAADPNISLYYYTTQRKAGTHYLNLWAQSGFTTGKACHHDLGQSTDFSQYQQIAFAVYALNADLNPADYSFKLCSDANGDVPIQTIDWPFIENANGRFYWVVIDTGAPLPSNVRSIAIHLNVDKGSFTVYIDNIMACKAPSEADALTPDCVIGKSGLDANGLWETWHPIHGIDEGTVYLGAEASANFDDLKGYSGPTGTFETFMCKSAVMTPATGSSSPTDAYDAVRPAKGGNAQNRLIIEGGWDRTDMSTKIGLTWVNFRNNVGSFPVMNSFQYGHLKDMGFFRGDGQLDSYAGGGLYENCHFTGAYTGFSGYGKDCEFLKCNFNNNTSDGVSITGHHAVFRKCKFNNNGDDGVNPQSALRQRYYDCEFRNLGGDAITDYWAGGMEIYLDNCLFQDIGGLFTRTTDPSYIQRWKAISVNHNRIPGAVVIGTRGGQIETQSSITHSGEGVAWKFSPLNTSNCGVNTPLSHGIVRVAVAAGSEVTISAWFRRSNTGLTGKLVLRTDQIPGLIADQMAIMSAAQDVWEQLTLAFTPTEKGVIEVEALCYGGTTYSMYVDDIEVSQ